MCKSSIPKYTTLVAGMITFLSNLELHNNYSVQQPRQCILHQNVNLLSICKDYVE